MTISKSKHSKDDFVYFDENGERVVGWVMSRKSTKYRVLSLSRKEYYIHSSKLKRLTQGPKVLILESNLSSGIEALRTDKQRRMSIFLEELLRSFDLVPLRAKVHSIKTLSHFMKWAARPDVWAVHFCGHGTETGSGKSKRNGLELTTEFMYLPAQSEQALEKKSKTKKIEKDLEQYKLINEVFSPTNLKGKILIFSACSLGRKNGFAEYISLVSKALSVIAYDRTVYDGQTNVAEAMLYWQLFNVQTKKKTPRHLVELLNNELSRLMAMKLPMYCFIDGVRYPK